MKLKTGTKVKIVKSTSYNDEGTYASEHFGEKATIKGIEDRHYTLKEFHGFYHPRNLKQLNTKILNIKKEILK